MFDWSAVGEINYGGRVTDENDRRLLNCLIQRFLSEDVLQDGHSFADGTQQAENFRTPAESGALVFCEPASPHNHDQLTQLASRAPVSKSAFPKGAVIDLLCATF